MESSAPANCAEGASQEADDRFYFSRFCDALVHEAERHGGLGSAQDFVATAAALCCQPCTLAAAMGRQDLLRHLLQQASMQAAAATAVGSDDGGATAPQAPHAVHAFLAAAERGQVECLSTLLDESASAWALPRECLLGACGDAGGLTALHTVASKGYVDCERVLLQHSPGTQVTSTTVDEVGWMAARSTPLILAAKNGHPECVRELLHHNPEAQVAAVSGRCLGMNALMYASWAGYTECCAALLQHTPDAQVLAADETLMTAAMFAARSGHVSVLELLLRHSPEAQVLACDQWGYTALIHAAQSGHAPCVRALLAAGDADVQVQAVDCDGRSALSHAAEQGQVEVVRLLLGHCAEKQVLPLPPDVPCVTPAMWAASAGHASVLRLLLTHRPHAQVQALDPEGRNALIHAAGSSHPACLEELLRFFPEEQISVAEPRAGLTAMRRAAACGHVECVQALLRSGYGYKMLAGGSGDDDDEHQPYPALHCAVLGGHVHVVRMLLKHDPEAQLQERVHGVSAVQLAARLGKAECLAAMLEAGPAEELMASSRGLLEGNPTPLVDASKKGHFGCVQVLLGYDLRAQRVDDALYMALAMAGVHGDDEGVEAGAAEPPAARFRRCAELLLLKGAKLSREWAPDSAFEVLWPIVHEFARQALLPGLATEAVVGLALAATSRKRKASKL